MEQTSPQPSKYNFTKKKIVTVLKTKHGLFPKILSYEEDLQYSLQCPSIECALEDGIEIGGELLKFLQTEKAGVGVSAIQFGIPKRVCAILVKEPIILVNPVLEVIGGSIEFPFIEGCLSIKDQLIKTKRNSSIKVTALNLGDNSLYADVTHLIEGNYLKSIDVLEMVAVQHEIDHLNGVLIDDPIRKWVNKQLKRDPIKNIGRNEIVKATNKISGEVIRIKFKKIEGDKDWIITPLA
jgi:peptide deformylase